MGLKVSASEAAYLVNRHERIVRGRIARGELPATKERNAWRIDVDDLERIPGWRLDRGRVAQLEERSARSVESLTARIGALERELRDVRSRLRMLETGGSDSALSRGRGQQHAPAPVVDDAEYLQPPESHYSANLVQVPAPAPGEFPSRQAVARFLGRHGIPEPTARSWYNSRPWPATPRDALGEVLRRLAEPDAFRHRWRNDFARCDDPACACAELLAAE